MSVDGPNRKQYYSSQDPETPRDSPGREPKTAAEKGSPLYEFYQSLIPSPSKGNPLKNRSKSLSDFREWADSPTNKAQMDKDLVPFQQRASQVVINTEEVDAD